MTNVVILKNGREKSIERHHPWIFSGAISEVRGNIDNGDTVDVLDSHGRFLARGAYSTFSQIRVRIWTWDPNEIIDGNFFKERLERAIAARKRWFDPQQTNAIRQVYAESDGLPGFIVDQYDDILVIQCLSSGAEFWRETLADTLLDLTSVRSIYERSDANIRSLEGLPEHISTLRGNAPPQKIQIYENGMRFWVDIYHGHKTGFYLDQRANRARVKTIATGCEVLDCFMYTGGFVIAALQGGARSVVGVETSADAIALAKENLTLNGLPIEAIQWIEGDVFQVLRSLRDQARSYDLIILDPPKFAQSPSHVERAARGYKDINLLALKLLKPGGILVTFSCSGAVSSDLFQKIVAGAAIDAGVSAQIIERMFQGADHPVTLNYPEGAYLKGLMIQVAV
jgi:23S rRNA (cytosine1962-C5)-methyltransferase